MKFNLKFCSNLRFKDIFLRERTVLFLVCLFIFINWVCLIHIEKLAGPDYYKYYFVSENFFSGEYQTRLIPPLFPILLGLSGRLLSLIMDKTDAFILAGRLITLISSIGVAYFSFKLLERFVQQTASIGIIFLIILPFYLKLLFVAKTDMLHLFFISATFYCLIKDDFKISRLWAVAGGLLTRFEGILLVGSAFLNYINTKKKNWIVVIGYFISGTAILYFLFFWVAPRLIHKLKFILTSKSYLYYFQHPKELLYLFYGNFLHYIPAEFPGFIKWFLLGVLLFVFFSGLFFIFKTRWKYGLSISFYMISFIFFKGYVGTLRHPSEFRLMIPLIWFFFIIGFIGICFLFQKIKKFKNLFILAKTAFYSFLIIVSFSLTYIKGYHIFLIFILAPVIFYGISHFKLRKNQLWILFFVLFIFSGQLFFDSYKRAYRYNSAIPNKAGYAIAQWINKGVYKKNVIIYSHRKMVQYYLKQPFKIKQFVFRNKNIYKNEKKLLASFLKVLKKTKPNAIFFDAYYNPKGRPAEDAIKKLLHREKRMGRNNQKKACLFRLKKTLFYKNKPVAWVLKPCYDNF